MNLKYERFNLLFSIHCFVEKETILFCKPMFRMMRNSCNYREKISISCSKSSIFKYLSFFKPTKNKICLVKWGSFSCWHFKVRNTNAEQLPIIGKINEVQITQIILFKYVMNGNCSIKIRIILLHWIPSQNH